jgi:sugar lactone lactonase YvrE
MELIADVRAELGEGPVWDAHDGVLLWIDIVGSSLFRLEPTSGHLHKVRTTVPVTALAPAEDGPPIVAWSQG